MRGYKVLLKTQELLLLQQIETTLLHIRASIWKHTFKPDKETQSAHSCIHCKHTDLSIARCALIFSPSRNLSGFSLSLPELLMENDTHGSELALILWWIHTHTDTHTESCKHLRTSECISVCGCSESEQGWVVTAESQERLCRSGLSWETGPGCIKGGITRRQPHVRVLSPDCCLFSSPFPRSPWGRICVHLTYPLTVCLNYSVPLCLSD